MPAAADVSHDSDPERSVKVAPRKHRIFSHFRKTKIARSVSEPKLQGLLAEGELGIQYLGQRNLVIWLQPITKSSTKDVYQETITGTLSWYKIQLLNGYSRSYPCKTKNFSGDGRDFRKVSRAVSKAESHTDWQLFGIWQGLWKSFLESLYFDTPSIRDEWGCWESSAQNKRRNVCRVVAIWLGWKVVGWFHGMLYLSAKHSQIYCLMGRRPVKDVLGNHLKDRLFHVVHWLSITLLLRRTSQESINLERKFYLDCSLDTLCTRGESGTVT